MDKSLSSHSLVIRSFTSAERVPCFLKVHKNGARPKVRTETFNLNVLPGENAFSYLVL